MGFIRSDGSLKMNTIVSQPGGDFNGCFDAYYFTPEKETAERYRQYAEKRCDWSETWMLRILVSDSFITKLKKQELWYSPDWKKYLWLSRNKEEEEEAYQPNLQRLIDADLVIGHVSRATDLIVSKKDEQEVQTEINENHVLQISTGKAKQWVFNAKTRKALADEIKGNIHIDVIAPRAQQYISSDF